MKKQKRWALDHGVVLAYLEDLEFLNGILPPGSAADFVFNPGDFEVYIRRWLNDIEPKGHWGPRNLEVPIERIVTCLEDRAREILKDCKLPPDIDDLWETWAMQDRFLSEDQLKSEGQKSTLTPGALAAKRVLLAGAQLRESLKKNDANRSALNVMLLIFASIEVENLREHLVTGVMRQQDRRQGGRKPKRLEGILLAIKEVLKEKPDYSIEQLWRYFKKIDRDNPMRIDDGTDRYEIYFDCADGRLCQIQILDDEDKEKSIAKKTFIRYTSLVKNR